MREVQIQIEPFSYIALQKLRISQNINNHGRAQIVMRIKDEWKESYIGTLASPTWVKVIGKGEDGRGEAMYIVLFHGLVTDFSLQQNGYETILTLILTSGTVLMDRKKHFRVFQNENADCRSIYQRLTSLYPKGKISIWEDERGKTNGVLIQHEETDWQFLKRLASRSGKYLVPINNQKGCGYTLGFPWGEKREIGRDKIRIQLNMEEYLTKQEKGLSGLTPLDMVEIIVTEREICYLGDFIDYDGKEYWIYHIETTYDGTECLHTYYLKTKEALQVLASYHEGIAGTSFEAFITNVKKDKVQVEIEGDEWKGEDGQKWFLYSTVYSSPDGTGWYCMPEIGDSVRLYVPQKEEESFILSAVHKETDSSRQVPEHKSFKTKHGKELLFTPDTILFTNNQGMTVEMNDQEGISIMSDKDVTIEAKDSVTISSEAGSVLVAAEEILQVAQGGTSMTLKEDISFTGGEFRIR